MQCAKSVSGFELKNGPYKGHHVLVDGPEYETLAAVVPIVGYSSQPYFGDNFYLDTMGWTPFQGYGNGIHNECYEAELSTKEKTGGLELYFATRCGT
jgi:hypothetical protein